MATPARNALAHPSSNGSTAKAAADRGTEVAGHARDAATEVRDTALERASEVKDEAVDHVRDLLSEAREQLDGHASAQAQQLGSSLRRLAEEFDEMCTRGEHDGPASKLVEQAAELSHQVADFFDGRQVGEIVDDIRGFARRRPGTFLLGAAGLGVLVGRLGRGARDVDQPSTPEGTTYAASSPQDPARISRSTNELAPVIDSAPPVAKRATAAGAATGATTRARTTSARKTAKPTASTRAATKPAARRRTAADPYPAEATPTRSRTSTRTNSRGGTR